MEQTFQIQGMTCQSCVAKVKSTLESESVVVAANPDLVKQEVKLKTSHPVDFQQLQLLLDPFNKYTISPSNTNKEIKSEKGSFKPLLIILGFLLLVTSLTQINQGRVDWMEAMRYFMGGFFLVFSFFKLLDLKGFADAYGMYDIVAKRFNAWAFIYPFVELGLGIAYILYLFPVWTNLITILVMGVSSIGVIKTVLNKEKIRCACLGTGFNLPMTTVTIVEDLTMVIMALVMLLNLL